MQIPKRKIKASLSRKGFVEEQGDHTYFYHEYHGKRTGAYAKLSHGTRYKYYGSGLIAFLRRQLRLDNNRQAIDLLTCPMEKEDYEAVLRKNGTIADCD